MRMLRCLGLVALIVTIVGCKAPPGKIKFNDRMVFDARDLMKYAFEFRKAVDEGSAANASSKMATIDKTLKEMKEYHNEALLPINSNSAEAYKKAYLDFLTAEEKCAEQMRFIVTCLEKKQTGPIAGAIAKVSEIEGPPLQALRTAQSAFFKEHNFNGVEKYPD